MVDILTSTTLLSRYEKIFKALYPNNIIPNHERALIEANAVERYLAVTSTQQVAATPKKLFKTKTKAKKTKGTVGAKTVRQILTGTKKSGGRPSRDIAADAIKVVTALKTSEFLTLSGIAKEFGISGYARSDELIQELAKFGVVETKVIIPYGRGYSRVFSIGPLKTYTPTAQERANQIAHTLIDRLQGELPFVEATLDNS